MEELAGAPMHQGCNPPCNPIHPCKAATPRTQACNSTYPRLQPHVLKRPPPVYHDAAGLREQLASSLASLGFASSSLEAQQGAAEGVQAGVRSAHKAGLVRAIVCAGLYPNVAEVRLPDTKYLSTARGAIETANEEARLVKYYVPGHGRVFIHPSSALFSATHFHKSPWLVYSSKQQTAKLYLRDVCLVSPMALLLFGGELSVQHEKQTIVIDGHITLAAPARVAVLVRETRTELQKLMARKIAEPAFDMNASSVLEVVIKLLTSDGAD